MGQSDRYRITDDGLMLPVAARVLERPEDFRPGPGGQYLDDLAREYVRKLVKPVWYVLPVDAGGPVSGSEGAAGDRTLVARIGFSRQDRTELFLYGRMKPGASTELDSEVIPVGQPSEYGSRVWGWQVHGGQTDWDIDVYHDERGFFWVIRQDPAHVAVGLDQRHQTRLQTLAAAIDHLREDGVPDLLPILADG